MRLKHYYDFEPEEEQSFWDRYRYEWGNRGQNTIGQETSEGGENPPSNPSKDPVRQYRNKVTISPSPFPYDHCLSSPALISHLP